MTNVGNDDEHNIYKHIYMLIRNWIENTNSHEVRAEQMMRPILFFRATYASSGVPISKVRYRFNFQFLHLGEFQEDCSSV